MYIHEVYALQLHLPTNPYTNTYTHFTDYFRTYRGIRMREHSKWATPMELAAENWKLFKALFSCCLKMPFASNHRVRQRATCHVGQRQASGDRLQAGLPTQTNSTRHAPNTVAQLGLAIEPASGSQGHADTHTHRHTLFTHFSAPKKNSREVYLVCPFVR